MTNWLWAPTSMLVQYNRDAGEAAIILSTINHEWGIWLDLINAWAAVIDAMISCWLQHVKVWPACWYEHINQNNEVTVSGQGDLKTLDSLCTPYSPSGCTPTICWSAGWNWSKRTLTSYLASLQILLCRTTKHALHSYTCHWHVFERGFLTQTLHMHVKPTHRFRNMTVCPELVSSILLLWWCTDFSIVPACWVSTTHVWSIQHKRITILPKWHNQHIMSSTHSTLQASHRAS